MLEQPISFAFRELLNDRNFSVSQFLEILLKLHTCIYLDKYLAVFCAKIACVILISFKKFY